MKKIHHLIFLIIALICITGCGKDHSKEELKNAFLKLKGTNAISMNFNMNMGTEAMKIPVTMSVDYNKDGMHLKVDSLGGIAAQEVYVLQKEEETLTYYFDQQSKKWYYTKTALATPVFEFSLDGLENGEKIDDGIDSFISTFDEVKKMKSDKEGYTKYELIINKNTLLEKQKENIEDKDELEEIEENLKSFPEKLIINIYLKDGELAIFSIDLSDIEIPNESMPEGMSMKFYDLSFELLARNENVKVSLPQEIEEKAIYVETKENTDDTSNTEEN